MLHVLVVLGSISSALAASLFPRTSAQTTVICPTSFSWANNQQLQSPCLVAAYAQGACYSNTWIVPDLQPGNSYTPSADACSCSWAVYNLLSACAACQNAMIPTWAKFQGNPNCSGRISTTSYYPPSTPVAGGTLFPYWATTNPSSWDNGQFQVGQAEAIAAEHNPDVNPDPPETSKSTPVGAIIGGAVGGFVVLVLGGVAVAWMISRRRKMGHKSQRPPHKRSTSDLSQKTATSGGYTVTLTSGGVGYHTPGSPTFSTRAHSVFGSARGSIFSTSTHAPSRVNSPPLPPITNLPENSLRIEPFLISPQSPSASSHRQLNRKTSNDTSIQPVNRADEGSSSLPARRNPPAYTPSVTSQVGGSQTPQTQQVQAARQAPGHGHRPGRGEKGSQDTQASFGSRSVGVSSSNHAGLSGGDRMASVPVHSRQTSADTVSTIQEGSETPLA